MPTRSPQKALRDGAKFETFSSQTPVLGQLENRCLCLGDAQVSGSNSRDIGDDVGVSVCQPAPRDNVFAGVVRCQRKPEIAAESLNQPRQMANPARDVLVDIAAVAHSEVLGC